MDGGRVVGDDEQGDPSSVGEAEVQRASAEFLERITALQRLEIAKRATAADDPARADLAARIEGLAIELLGRSQYQARLVSGAAASPASPPRPVHLVLADWRDAERRLLAAHGHLQGIVGEIAGFQDEYRRSMRGRDETG